MARDFPLSRVYHILLLVFEHFDGCFFRISEAKEKSYETNRYLEFAVWFLTFSKKLLTDLIINNERCFYKLKVSWYQLLDFQDWLILQFCSLVHYSPMFPFHKSWKQKILIFWGFLGLKRERGPQLG